MPIRSAARRRGAWNRTDSLQALFAALPTAAMACDPDRNIVYVNPAAARLLDAETGALRQRFGVDPRDLVGTPIDRLGCDRQDLDALSHRPADGPYTTEFALDGRRLHLDVSAAYADNREVAGWVAVLTDMTESETADSETASAAAGLGEASDHMAEVTARLDVTTGEVRSGTATLADNVEELITLMTGVADGADMIRDSTLAVVDAAHSAGGSVAELRESSDQIGEFTATITSIAEQTKLLALNATIEATRAGAAGSGFAVVAKEVKDLAQRAGTATDEISGIVDAIRQGSEAAGAALETITTKVDVVGEQQLSVNKIVDQQVEKVDEIAASSKGLTGSVEILAEVVTATGDAAAAVAERTRAVHDHLARAPEAHEPSW